jgi:hypothetical protein
MARGARRILSRLAVLAIAVLVSLGAAELVLRSMGYRGEVSFRIQDTVIVDDPVLNWRHKPNGKFYSNDILYEINERGFRDHVYPYRRPGAGLRIFLASDSVGFGTSVHMRDSYPKLLEAKLNALRPQHRVEVLNHSMPGLSIRQKLHLAERYAAAYRPDVIIIDYVVNDIEFESRRPPDRNYDVDCSIALLRVPIPCAWKSVLKQSALAFSLKSGLEGFLDRLKWEDQNQFYRQVESDYYHRLYSTPERLEYLKKTFAQIRRYQDETGVKIIVPIFPLFYDLLHYKWRDIDDLVRDLCVQNGLSFISLLDEYRKYDYHDLRVQRGDFTHPSVMANRVAADVIAPVVLRIVDAAGK